MEVYFTHPRSSKQFVADVGPNCTGQQAVLGLLAGDENGSFLDQPVAGRPYELVLARTRQQITPNTRFGDLSVVDGDVIEVMQAGQGA